MHAYLELAWRTQADHARYLWTELGAPHGQSWMWWLAGVSILVYALELIRPWRTEQARIRRDFWLDLFYIVFNSFLFPLIGYQALASVSTAAFHDLLAHFGVRNLVALRVDAWPVAMQLLVLFVLRDFIHWNVHRLMHARPRLWELHKVHHSVREMGFAAHLRFHWMETVVFRSIEYPVLALIGFGVDDFFIVYLATLIIGHLNHANFSPRLGPLLYLFNSARMHIWHHMHTYPERHPRGVNFAISLSIWDWLFGSAYLPADGRDIRLGFEGIERFPQHFGGQVVYGLRSLVFGVSRGGGR